MASAVHAVRPRLVLRTFPFLSSIPARQPELTATELVAFAGTIELPPEYLGRIEVSDTVDGGLSFSVTIPNAYHKTVYVRSALPVRMQELFRVGDYVQLTDDDVPVFAGFIQRRSISYAIDHGGVDLILTGAGVEATVQEQTVFIDFLQRESDRVQVRTAEAVAATPSNRLPAAITTFTESISNFRDAAAVIQAIATASLQLKPGRYGGRSTSELLALTSALTAETYTTGFLHVLNWISQAQPGSTISYWDFLQTFAVSPLYELFANSSGDPCWISAGRSSAGADTSTPAELVFRKTPWMHLDAPLPDPALTYELDPTMITGVPQFEEAIGEIITGISVTTPILDQVTGALVAPVLYFPAGVEKYGQRILPVHLSGIKFPDEDQDGASVALRERLSKIQDDFAAVFSSGRRHIYGSIPMHYHRDGGNPRGKIISIKGLRRTWPPPLRRFDRTMYCQGVSRVYEPGGSVSQTLSVKWARERESTYV